MKNNKLYTLIDHQDKSRAYVDALKSVGWETTKEPQKAHFVLADCDAEVYWNRLQGYKRVFTYPHAARPWVALDCGWNPYPATSCNFVQAQGHIDSLRAYGFIGPLAAVGWTYCEIKPFQPCPEPVNVLFMPIHPNRNGWLGPDDKAANIQAFLRLTTLHARKEIKLTVRFVGSLEAQGLWGFNDVKFVQGQPDQTTHEIDKADVVVATQTAQYIAVARGKPVVGMSESTRPHIGNKPENYAYARSWEKYKDIMAFPLDILEGDPMGVLRQAGQGCERVEAWKARMIGEQFSAARFIETINKYL